MDDNLNLSETYKQTQKKLYSGAFYERKIMGRWIIAEGLVYDTFSEEKHTCTHVEVLEKIKNNEFIEYFIGLDWGWNHPTACLLYGVTKSGVYYQIDELFGSKIEAERIIDWIESKQKEYERYFSFVNADNARPEQNHKLRQALRLSIYEDKPRSVEDSVAVVRSVINYDRLIINKDKCPNTINELSVYRYPSEAARLTHPTANDAPLKENDDCMDAKRYAITFYETRRQHRF
jgi:PBSX family phage terminase large subunit